jgi:hypothetical protein
MWTVLMLSLLRGTISRLFTGVKQPGLEDDHASG